MNITQKTENSTSVNSVDDGVNDSKEPASKSESNNEAPEKDNGKIVENENAIVESDNAIAEENKETPEKKKRLKREFDDSEENIEILPKELKKMFGPLECELCNVKSNSTLTAFSHYKGKIHKKNIEKYLIAHNLSVTPKKAKVSFTPINCEHCNVLLTSEMHKLQHFSGKSHKRRVLNPSYKVKVQAAEKDPTGRFGIGKLFLKNDPSSGTSNEVNEVSEEPEIKEETEEKFYCELCNVTTTSAETLDQHKSGAKHLKKAHFINEDYEFLAKYRTPSNNYYCDICNVLSNSGDQFLMHIKSKRHKKVGS